MFGAAGANFSAKIPAIPDFSDPDFPMFFSEELNEVQSSPTENMQENRSITSDNYRKVGICRTYIEKYEVRDSVVLVTATPCQWNDRSTESLCQSAGSKVQILFMIANLRRKIA
ncbi:hypothetical protein WA026_007402 [Henosepilachna vigintioctopunctata]|uniref:Uncharacterized protein n=1 Tax=Henosepilachna vigintioctopunctata TaxID=420089 RepID=A0AAW1ULS4_9CUCU